MQGVDVFSNDHFLLGVGLASGPAIILIFGAYAFFKWGKTWKGLIIPCGSDHPQCVEHSGIVKDTAFVIMECKTIWTEIKDINVRQMSLRERLPRDYVSKDDLNEIKGRLKSIDQKLDRYFELSVTTKHSY